MTQPADKKWISQFALQFGNSKANILIQINFSVLFPFLDY